MRMFFVTVGVLAWLLALGVFIIFAESGGALTVIAAGIYALVAVVAIGCERLLKTLEDIRDGNLAGAAPSSRRSSSRSLLATVPQGASAPEHRSVSSTS